MTTCTICGKESEMPFHACGTAIPSPGHDGDCTIYRALMNGRPYDGICTCGYGWRLARTGDRSEMLSKERQGNAQ